MMATKGQWRGNLWIAWRIIIVLAAIGMFVQLKNGDFTGFWVFALIGLPTIILANDLSKSVKQKLLWVFASSFIVCGLYCLTPTAKSAHAKFEADQVTQSDRDVTIVVEKKKQAKFASIVQKRQDAVAAQKQAKKVATQAVKDKAENEKKWQIAGEKLIDFQANCVKGGDPYLADAKYYTDPSDGAQVINHVVVVVADNFFSQPHQVRLEEAQNLVRRWKQVYGGNNAAMDITDSNGNIVGGSSLFGMVVVKGD